MATGQQLSPAHGGGSRRKELRSAAKGPAGRPVVDGPWPASGLRCRRRCRADLRRRLVQGVIALAIGS